MCAYARACLIQIKLFEQNKVNIISIKLLLPLRIDLIREPH